jgi:flagellar biosynthetic protein FliR
VDDLVACFARAATFCQAAPVLGHAAVPAAWRLAMAAVLAVLTAPAAAAGTIGVTVAERVLGEGALGLALALVLGAAWSVLERVLVPLARAAGFDEDPSRAEDDGPFARLGGLIAIAGFLAVSGDHLLLSYLTQPIALAGLDLAGIVLALGRHVFAVAGCSLVPLLGALVVARVAAALASRRAAFDLAPLVAPALAVLLVLSCWVWALIASPAVHEALTGVAPTRNRPAPAPASAREELLSNPRRSTE